MKTESHAGPTPGEPDEQPWREAVSKLLGSKKEVRPAITCECAWWGSPCPHSLWSEKSATTAKAN
jgi:hypothetical protein